MLSKPVLVKNVSNLSEARYCAGMMVDFITFEINPNHAFYVDKNTRDDIIKWVQGVKIILSYSNGDIDQLKEALKNNASDGILLSPEQFTFSHELETNSRIFEILESCPLPEHTQNDFFIISPSLLPYFENQKAFVGYDYSFIKHQSEAFGFAFEGKLESSVGEFSNEELMDALENLDI
ncbi:MAG: hypothetical protein ACRCVT_14550 [Leadbetterella sp.]